MEHIDFYPSRQISFPSAKSQSPNLSFSFFCNTQRSSNQIWFISYCVFFACYSDFRCVCPSTIQRSRPFTIVGLCPCVIKAQSDVFWCGLVPLIVVERGRVGALCRNELKIFTTKEDIFQSHFKNSLKWLGTHLKLNPLM